MIVILNKKTDELKKGIINLSYLYVGDLYVFGEINNSCYGSGVWRGDLVWKPDDVWRSE